MIVFGVMFIVMTTAEVLVRETVGGTLRRLQLTRLRARDLLLGITLAPNLFGQALQVGHGLVDIGLDPNQKFFICRIRHKRDQPCKSNAPTVDMKARQSAGKTAPALSSPPY
jgi:hypothetical protein